ncbi:hypothetical protein [Pseudoduganella chitinolytica]|uniref:Uncharacterized protein n=1 Tax=Pseudoduganella chitinolytica TaxID=34070 RepID=A0ABY8BEG0_9BURK|nr:hypothetical protein [Pseudoduganella chitinolytica]WEF34304.1 hypothetical protein PX653_05895 [Pseudoduganella chitinolytica]
MTIEIGKLSIKSSVANGNDTDKKKDQEKDQDEGECCGKPGARNRTSQAGAWLADLRRQADELAERARER